MVKFIGGPSINAYKSYRNHTVAREGQWRNLRPSYNTKSTVNIRIRNYNNSGYSYGGYGFGGFQLPAWLQWAQFGLDWISQLFPQKQPTVDETNPFAAQLEELKAENEELKKKLEQKQASPEPGKPNGEVPTPQPDPKAPENVLHDGGVDPLNGNDDKNKNIFNVSSELNENTQTVKTNEQVTVEGKQLTTEIIITPNPDNANLTTGWDRILDGYIGPDGKPANAAERKLIRTYLRNELLDGDQNKFFKCGAQHMLSEVPGINSKTFKFVKANYDASKNWTPVNNGKIISVNTNSQNTQTQTITKQVEKEVKTYTASVKISGVETPLTTKEAHKSAEAARKDLIQQIKALNLPEAQEKQAIESINTAEIKKNNKG